MEWQVLLAEEFEPEFAELPRAVRIETVAHMELLQRFGPQLRRPYVDTMKGSDHPNMKELRFDAADGVWRVAFAFDPERNAVLLLAGDKSGDRSASTAIFFAKLTNVFPRTCAG